MLFTYPRRNYYFQAIIDGTSCLFENNPHISHCEGDGKLITATVTRLINIIEKSKLRNDLLHLDIAKLRSENGDNMRFKYHKNCVLTYTSKDHIKRALSKERQCSSSETTVKRRRRSENHEFNWKRHCFFCDEMCLVKPDPKHPDRWCEAYESHTSERPGRPTLKNTILMVNFYSVYLKIQNHPLGIASFNLKQLW